MFHRADSKIRDAPVRLVPSGKLPEIISIAVLAAATGEGETQTCRASPTLKLLVTPMFWAIDEFVE
jgi:hypothetical protein